MKGLVLSGGTGTRLQPFTLSMPKQLIPVANRPVLSYILLAMADIGIAQTGIITSEEGMERIPLKLAQATPSTMELTYIKQSAPLGLAHAVKTARPFLGDDDFIMVLGDNIFDRGFADALHIFKQTKADALIYLTPVDDPWRFGIAEVRNGRVCSLEEKPAVPRSNLAIMGIYLFTGSVFEAIGRIQPSARGELEITDALQELLQLGGKVVPYHYPGWWHDVGTPEDVLAANRKILDLLQGNNIFIPPGKGVFKDGANCSIASSAVLSHTRLEGPLIIGEGCRISNSYLGPYSAIGRGSIIDHARISECILCEGAEISNLKAMLWRSIIAENARVLGDDGEKGTFKLMLGAASTVRIG